MQPDLKAYEAAIDENTVFLYACAPTYPHGVMDPIQVVMITFMPLSYYDILTRM